MLMEAKGVKSAPDFHHWLNTVTNTLEMSACPSFQSPSELHGSLEKDGETTFLRSDPAHERFVLLAPTQTADIWLQ